MKIFAEPQSMMGANCYMLSSDKTAVVIDPSAVTEALTAFLRENSEKALYIVATHRHCDHIAAVADLKKQFGGTVAVSAADACGLMNTTDSLGTYLGIQHSAVAPDMLLEEGDVLLGDIAFQVLNTPGHTAGSICLITEDALISGDTLFYLSIGRTDFPSGNAADMQRSLARLFSLDRDYTVYPGHGEATSLFFERQNNPYFIREF
jgi:glyoxylase-like metal-dependent hydrolase (beta-lactamase superfamily II)